ncbi:DUF4810 domain-containing protein [Chitinimonas sp. PSY-7]|uniref:DUF4810 domain-containing protein n=1 Tax=Chitinimonas sp. PSY-7 TaxID=3459088 RepID=UPI004040318D
MKSTFSNRLAFASVALGAVMLGGCATPSRPLYNWGSYQQQVYESLKDSGSSPEQQISALERDMQKAQAKGEALPPGFHAHLAMLYAKVGKSDQVRQQLEAEKAQFPESTTFMDFLLRKFKK